MIISIEVNGRHEWTLGGSEMPQAGVYVGNQYKSDKITVSYNAYRQVGPAQTEHFEWPDRVLAPGDVVTLRVQAEGDVSKPEKSSIFDNTSNIEATEKRVAELIAKVRLRGVSLRDLSGDTSDRAMCFCSFCGSHVDDVEALIAGAGVYICNKCVSACQEAIEQKGKGQE